ncbi:unnamed protein product [Nezara viridula]|uniref:Uncharacterized protein n=1 Tax=Nezara viridula TaxID=85310 RepID=A0A9P0HN35_NEZVI|nr:unnamed protein product [Nezara viridula]
MAQCPLGTDPPVPHENGCPRTLQIGPHLPTPFENTTADVNREINEGLHHLPYTDTRGRLPKTQNSGVIKSCVNPLQTDSQPYKTDCPVPLPVPDACSPIRSSWEGLISEIWDHMLCDKQ